MHHLSQLDTFLKAPNFTFGVCFFWWLCQEISFQVISLKKDCFNIIELINHPFCAIIAMTILCNSFPQVGESLSNRMSSSNPRATSLSSFWDNTRVIFFQRKDPSSEHAFLSFIQYFFIGIMVSPVSKFSILSISKGHITANHHFIRQLLITARCFSTYGFYSNLQILIPFCHLDIQDNLYQCLYFLVAFPAWLITLAVTLSD